MNVVEKYKDEIRKIDQFVRSLDPAVRGEAFRYLLERTVSSRPDEIAAKAESFISEELGDEAQLIFKRISQDSGVPFERLMEVFAYDDSSVQVIDISITHEGPTDLLKKITLLCTYGNIVGRRIAKVELSTIYKNLKTLKAATTSYSRDVKMTEGVKVVADGVMLPPAGREKAQAMLRQILTIGA
jgi:hypothetical protein